MCVLHVCVFVSGCALYCTSIWSYRTSSLVYTITEINLVTQSMRIETYAYTPNTLYFPLLFSTFTLYLSFFSSFHLLSFSSPPLPNSPWSRAAPQHEVVGGCHTYTHTHTAQKTMMPWHSRNVSEPIGNSHLWEMNEWKEHEYLMRASGVDKWVREGEKEREKERKRQREGEQEVKGETKWGGKRSV